MPTIRVRGSAGSYDVICQRGAAGRLAGHIRRVSDPASTFFLSSPNVWRHWGGKLVRAMGGLPSNRIILFDDRESAKRLRTVEQVCRKLLRAGAERRSLLIGVGGGVVGDIAGFVAASYMRGVKLVHVPTTLVAQVDSAIGGKTGVDLPEGKNLVGAFYSPELTVADSELLRTLASRQYRSGLYEVVKYGVIADRRLFDFLERNMPALLERNPRALARVIPSCVSIKARIVSKDERESGLRQILNFGHTFGHALEAATNYRRFAHGEAVGWGMAVAALLGVSMGRLRESEAERILRLIARLGPLPPLPRISSPRLQAILSGDKKARGGRALWVLPRRIGKVEWGCEVPWPAIWRTYLELPALMALAWRRA